MGDYDLEIVVTHGVGSHVVDEAGRQFLDATASLWYANVGYGREEIAEAVNLQLRTLHAYSNFGTFATRPTLDLADRIAAVAPVDDPVVFFTSGGSDGVDTAAKIARRYWSAVGKPRKQALIHRHLSYHGMHGFGTALAGIEWNREGFGDSVDGAYVVPHDDPMALEDAIWDIGAGRVAAFFVEPVIGSGGVIPPAAGYLENVARICKRHDVLLIADEVITGFGRLGHLFGCDRFGIRPDLAICAKGLTSGYLPLGAVVISGRVAEPFWATDATLNLRHGYTYSGHAAACVAALTNLDIIERERLVDRVADLEPILADALEALRDHSAVADVRHIGLLGAVEFSDDLVAAVPDAPKAAVRGAREAGILTRLIGGPSLHVSPPFVISVENIDEIVAGLRAGLDAALNTPRERSEVASRPIDSGAGNSAVAARQWQAPFTA